MHTNTEKAKLFNQFVSSVFTEEDLYHIAIEIHIIFTKSLESSTLPDEWKIQPIFGNRHLPNNNRPIIQ